MDIATRTYRLTGIAPLLMHRAAGLLDPNNPLTVEMKKITDKKSKKTDSDIEDLRRLEWMNGVYINADRRVIVCADNMQAMLVESARKTRKGKTFSAGVFIEEDSLLEYDGPKDLDKLYADPRFVDRRSVVVTRNRVIRTRPVFPQWSLLMTVCYMPSVVSVREIDDAASEAGTLVGLGDYRPRFGRFTTEVVA